MFPMGGEGRKVVGLGGLLGGHVPDRGAAPTQTGQGHVLLFKMVQILAGAAGTQGWRGFWPSVPEIRAILSPYPLEKIPPRGVKAS